MSSDIQTALLVLVVGMVTVFVILGLVVLTGHVLIRLVNRFFADQPPQINIGVSADPNVATPLSESDSIPKATIAAIVSAVDILTEGKGKVRDIRTK